MIGWLLSQLIETVGGWISEICNWAMARIASEGLVIFDEPVIKAIIEKIYVIGLGLWGIGCVLAVFDMATTMSGYNARLMYINERSAHALKYETIKNCIFAADIEPSAVDIAQLRLWLALVIDDEINPNSQSPLDGHRNPLPLPNLECNILCGNSLMDEFEGYNLIVQSSAIATSVVGEEYSWNQNELEAMIPKLIEAQDQLFKCDDPNKKIELKEKVNAIKDQMIRTQLSAMPGDLLAQYESSKHLASKPYVLWQVDFARVFNEKGGFDVVIGNPPSCVAS